MKKHLGSDLVDTKKNRWEKEMKHDYRNQRKEILKIAMSSLLVLTEIKGFKNR